MTQHADSESLKGASLVVINSASHPVMASIKGVSYDDIQRLMEEETSFQSMFPGTAYTFKKGHWYQGFGKKAELQDKLFRSKSIIVNAVNVNFAWRTFTDEGKPAYLAFANPALGQKLPERKTLGNTDKSFWPVSEMNGKPQDPISKIAMVPFRFDGETEVNHFMFNSWSAVRAVQDFMKAFGTEGRRHTGKLPVVNVDASIEKHWEDDSITFEVPILAIADWEDPIPEDEGGVIANDMDAGRAIEPPKDGGVTSSNRVDPPKKAATKSGDSFLDGLPVDEPKQEGLFPGSEGEQVAEKVKANGTATSVGGGTGRRRGTNGAASDGGLNGSRRR